MLKTFAIFSFSVLFFVGCESNKQNQQMTNGNISAVKTTDNNSLIVSGHSQMLPTNNSSAVSPTNTAPQKSGAKTKWTQSGSPIDTSAFDAEISRAQEKLKAKPEDKNVKAATADAFLKRGTALTEVGQYASALGDYRRVLRYDADNQAAKTWINKIMEIYESINREAPQAGEEPPPLPFEKKK